MSLVRQIKVGKHSTGIVGLDDMLKEVAVTADLEHVRDMKEIASYGVMGSPALVINRKVKSMGSVPSKSKLKDLILEAELELKEQQGV